MFRMSVVAALLSCWALVAQDSRNMILAASQSGVVELIDPRTLETVGRIHLDLGLESVGLKDMHFSHLLADQNGSNLYGLSVGRQGSDLPALLVQIETSNGRI